LQALPTVDETDVEFLDPKAENEKVTDLDAVSIVACCLIAVFTLLTGLSTMMLWSKAKDALKLQRARSLNESPSQSQRRSL